MLWILAAFGTAVADETAETRDVAARIAQWEAQAPRLAKRSCRGEPKTCRTEVEQAIRRVLRDPDAEAELELLAARNDLAPLVQFCHSADVTAYLFDAYDACLAREDRGIEESAARIARQLCAGREDAATCTPWAEGFVRDLAREGNAEPDGYLNELDALESFATPAQMPVIDRLRASVERRCPSI